MSRLFDVVIIGAGHNGLVAAGYLARIGLSVAVIEQSPDPGGLCQTREVLPGLRGNMAVNSAHNLDPEVVDVLELERHGLEWINLGDASSMALLPGGKRIISFHDPSRAKAEYDFLGAGEYDAYRQILLELNELGQALDVSFYDPPPKLNEIRARVPAGRLAELFEQVMFGSATELVCTSLTSEELCASLAMLAVAGNYVGPSTPGSAFQLAQRPMYRGSSASRGRVKVLGTAEYALRTPRGGAGMITTAMERSARAQGVTFLYETAVERIEVRHDRVHGVHTPAGEIRARAVLSAINPVHTMLKLVPRDALEDVFVEELSGIRMEGCMAKIYLALDDLPQFAAARDDTENLLMARCGFRAGPTIAEMDASYARSLQGSWDGQPVVYGLVQTVFDDSLNREGRHLMSLSVSYAPRHLSSGTWADSRTDWVSHVVTWLTQHILNLPNIIVDSGCLTTEDLETQLGLTGGNALHGDIFGASVFDARPFRGHTDYTTPLSGLYCCSSGTWPGNYVSGLSGRNAAIRVANDLVTRTDS